MLIHFQAAAKADSSSEESSDSDSSDSESEAPAANGKKVRQASIDVVLRTS